MSGPAQHTPGPWRAERGGNEFRVCIRAEDGNRIAIVDAYDGPANGRLIAQAPALVDALRDAVRFMDSDIEEIEYDDGRCVTRGEAWRRARAVLAACSRPAEGGK